MANVIEVVLKANDQMSGNLKKAQTGTQKFTQSLVKMVAMVGGIAVLTMGIKKLLALAGQQEEAEFRLAAAMRQKGVYTELAIRHNLAYAASLQLVSRYGDEQIMVVQEMLTYFGIEGEMLDKLTASTLDLAAAKRMDLMAAADLVAKSVGSTTNALTRYGIAVEGAAGSTERMQMAVDNISKIFSGAAAAAAETYTGRLEQVKNALGDLGEEIAAGALPTLTKTFQLAAKGAEQFSWYLEHNRMELQKLLKVGEEAKDVFGRPLVEGDSWFVSLFKTSPLYKWAEAIRQVRTDVEDTDKAILEFAETLSKSFPFPGMELYLEVPAPDKGPSAQMLALAAAIEKVKQGWKDAAMQDLAKFMAGGQRMGALEPRGGDTGMGDRDMEIRGFDQLEELPEIITPGLDAMDELTAKWAEMGVTAESVSQGIGNAFGNAAFSMLASGQNLFAALKSEATRWAAHTIAEIIRVKMTMMMLDFLLPGSGTAAGAGYYGGSGAGGGGWGGGTVTQGSGPATIINNYYTPAIDAKSLRYAYRHGDLGREARKAGF